MNSKPLSASLPPILTDKAFADPSVFQPANLLREARRQKRLTLADIPEICVLDPDGDILRVLRREQRASVSAAWACYHTELYEFEQGAERCGIIGCAVGASFAVLLAEAAVRLGLPVSDQRDLGRARSSRKGRRPISS